ncbi:MAG: HigA family addiction module antitoxin [Pseudomonadota bacterium]
MSEHKAIRNPDRCPSHPGAVLADILEDLDLTKVQIAGMLEISRQQLYDILNERKPVSADVAGRLGRLFGNGAGLWLRLQANYDAWHADRDKRLSKITPLPRAS